MFQLTISPPATGSATTSTTGMSDDEVVARIRPLLTAAARLDLQDREGWARLVNAARVTIGVLVQGGRLPAHLTIAEGEAPIVVQRTVAAAWSHVTNAPRRIPGSGRTPQGS